MDSPMASPSLETSAEVLSVSAADAVEVAVAPGRRLGVAEAEALHAVGALTVKDLPAYSLSLLRIPVPVVVTLAQKRQILGRIVEIGPGSIVQFDKSCDEMLELHIGDRLVALGEAVKVGDKFGLRITSMVLPGERFEKVVPSSRSRGPARASV